MTHLDDDTLHELAVAYLLNEGWPAFREDVCEADTLYCEIREDLERVAAAEGHWHPVLLESLANDLHNRATELAYEHADIDEQRMREEQKRAEVAA